MKATDIAALLPYLTAAEREELNALLASDRAIWRPLPGPQTQAFLSEADIIGYGGAAGGGKTDLACGLALTQHTVSAIFRREATQLTGVIDRLTELIGDRAGYNGSNKIWRLAERQIEFGSTPNPGDETKHQGRPKDLLVLDEATNFLELQARFLMGWVRTTKAGQRCRVLMTFNPPTSAEGQWVIKFFAPWLDKNYPRRAAPGELRWFATIAGKDVEVKSGSPFAHKGELIKPLSRTFIPSRLSDNPYLMGTGYMSTLQALPEPLRSQMLNGDFEAGVEDDRWQVIPTAWVDAAMKRWKPRDAKGPMDSMGVDVARGGRDATVVARRHGTWFDELVSVPGRETPDGPSGAAVVLANRRDRAPVHVDVIGVGSSVFDFLVANDVQAIPVQAAGKTTQVSRDGTLAFANVRAMTHWRMREALDPTNPDPIALPNDSELRADLCAARWRLGLTGIQVESKDDIIKRIGRSPDKGDAIALARLATQKHAAAGSDLNFKLPGIV